LQDRARAMAQMRVIWHCKIIDTTPVLLMIQYSCHVFT